MTNQDTEVEVTSRARDAVDRGHWTTALELLGPARRAGSLAPQGLELLAEAAYGAGQLEEAIAAREEAHLGCLAVDDLIGAANAATQVAVHLLMDTGLMAPVRGWLARADRLLEDGREHPVHAWIAMVRAYERLLCGDADAAREWAERAIEVGTRQSEPAPVAIARVATARLLILDGQVERGLALLDEAAVSIVSGGMNAIAAGIIYCELICAMQGLAQYDRAEEWTAAMERWRTDGAIGAFHGRCRVHRAELLRLRGSCADAHTEALLACDELRPWMRREYGWPLTELGTIRLRMGDLDGAEEAFLTAHDVGWDPQPGLAFVRLAQGEVKAAVAMVRGALEHPSRVPSKERPPYGGLPRAPLLEAQVTIALASDDVATAEEAAQELTGLAASFRSTALLASAALARGRVGLALDDPAAAVEACNDAVAAWSDVGAPYETAVARMTLASAHQALGNDVRATLELRAAHAAFERIGAAPPVTPARSEPRVRVAEDAGGSSASQQVSVFRRQGDTRSVRFGGSTVVLRDLKGMRYLERLLEAPGREFHALDLVTAEHGTSAGVSDHPHADAFEVAVVVDDGTGPALDARATEAYRRRLGEIDDDIDEAARMGDGERVALAEADRDHLVSELARAYGLDGRRRPTNSSAERARASVTRAVRYAITKIRVHHPELAAHLEHTIHTGTYCSYTPDPRASGSWQLT